MVPGLSTARDTAPPMTDARIAAAVAADAAGPPRRLQVANVVVTQAGWFAAVLGAAHGLPHWGLAAVAAGIAWHLSIAPRPGREAALVALVALIGALAETLVLALGFVRYPSAGGPVALGPLTLPPPWLLALWALFATSLNLTLRALHRRRWLAALLGAVAGPLAFAGGVKLGAAEFVDARAALAVLAVEWALLLPLVAALAARLDGIAGGAAAAAPPPAGAMPGGEATTEAPPPPPTDRRTR